MTFIKCFRRIEKLEAEAKTSSEKFDEISKRWSAARMKEIPGDLHEMLVEQTQACDAVIDEKNKLIHLLQLVGTEFCWI